MRTIDQRVKYLEKSFRVPGTQITRVLMDRALCISHGVKMPRQRAVNEAHLIWCVALGELMSPKRFFYGRNIDEAVRRADLAMFAIRKQEGSATKLRRRRSTRHE
jgi:hypothetical protein